MKHPHTPKVYPALPEEYVVYVVDHGNVIFHSARDLPTHIIAACASCYMSPLDASRLYDRAAANSPQELPAIERTMKFFSDLTTRQHHAQHTLSSRN